jgi:hypothetical protein
MNHMDPESKVVHIRLEHWGKLCADRWSPWPHNTLLGKIIEYGLSGAAQAGKPMETIPEEVAETDAAVAKLNWTDKRAVSVYYTRQEPVEACAKRCHMRIRQFQNVLRRARWRIALHLNVTQQVV